MANKVITVTDPSVVTNDTLSGYNNYSDIDGQLGTTMTPTEATNGKTITLSDGVVHEVTTKPVGTTNGEFSAVVSNAVTVDLIVPVGFTPFPASGAGSTIVASSLTDLGNNSYRDTTDGSIAGSVYLDAAKTGDFEYRILFSDNTQSGSWPGSARNVALGIDASGDSALNDMDIVLYRTTAALTLKLNGSITSLDNPPTLTYTSLDDQFLRLKRVGTTVTIYWDDQGSENLIHTTTVSGTVFLIARAGSLSDVFHPEYI